MGRLPYSTSNRTCIGVVQHAADGAVVTPGVAVSCHMVAIRSHP